MPSRKVKRTELSSGFNGSAELTRHFPALGILAQYMRCRSPELSRVCSRNLSQPGGGWLSSDEQVRVRRLFRMKGLAPVHAHEHLLGKEKGLFTNGPV